MEWLPGLFPLPQLRIPAGKWPVPKVPLQNFWKTWMELLTWKQSERFLSPVDLQIVSLFLQGKQNLIQLYKVVEAPKHLVGKF